MEPAAESPSSFEFSGGSLCLDFVNTLGDRPHCRHERLGAFADLLRWGVEAGLVDRAGRDRLAREAERHPRIARAFLRGAVEHRELLYRIFSGLAGGGLPEPADVEALNRALAASLSHLRLARADGRFGWSWQTPDHGFEWLLWPVTRSAAELLASDEAAHVRECASDRCSWLFVDRSRTRRRRWCDMKVCGNRAKARRHYARKRRSTGH